MCITCSRQISTEDRELCCHTKSDIQRITETSLPGVATAISATTVPRVQPASRPSAFDKQKREELNYIIIPLP